MNYRPVFIAGCDRSGTTLLGDMLGNGRWTMTTPESQFIHDLAIQIQLGSFDTAESAADWLLNNFRFSAWGLELSPSELAAQIDLDNTHATIQNLLAVYARQFHADKTSADVWIDHTPDNFKYHPLLKSLFPEARFIHIVRDGRGVCASIKHLNWGPNNAYTASRHWADRLQEALTVEVAERDNCLRVHFEDLLIHPEETMSKVCAFIDVPYENDMLNGGGLVVPEFTRGQHALIGKRPQAARAESWRGKLSDAELRDFESYPLSRTLLMQLGYQPVFDEAPVRPVWRIFGCYCHNFFHYLKNRTAHRAMERSHVARQRETSERQGDDRSQQLVQLDTAGVSHNH